MKTIEIIIEPMTDFCEAFNRAKALLMDDETPMSVKDLLKQARSGAVLHRDGGRSREGCSASGIGGSRGATSPRRCGAGCRRGLAGGYACG